jgi:hypothetical protein
MDGDRGLLQPRRHQETAMAIEPEALDHAWSLQSESNPFGEALGESEAATTAAPPTARDAWQDSFTPFEEWRDESVPDSEDDRLVEEAFAEFRDEAFDEAVAYLADETEQAVSNRFAGETAGNAAERERFAETLLSPVHFEALQYLDALEAGLGGLDLESLDEAQLDEVLARFDPSTGETSPAGEEFIGALARKAKKAVKFVARTARNVGKTVVRNVGKVASSVLGPVLSRLKALVRPLLKRVLSFAIGRLPPPLQPAARKLAAKFLGEHESDEAGEADDARLSDPEALAESFDAALAESLLSGSEAEMEDEAEDPDASAGSRELERLAEARVRLVERVRHADDGEDLSPEVEQFVPALLGALRIGINLVGRPKVVSFLAGFLGRAIRGWVGPKLAGPLSSAIVDTGLRLVALESPGDGEEPSVTEAAPQAIAAVIEDTVRRFAANEAFVFEDEALMRIAGSEAFGEAVATHFPERFVRTGLQQAPSLGGAFVVRRPRSVRAFHKYTRTPEIEITEQLADALQSFGGSTVGAALRAAGTPLPMRARVHMYQAAPGTTLSRLVRMDHSAAGGHGHVPVSAVHPLTPQAAGMLLREPRLGSAVAPAWLRSRQRVAPGQRVYVLQPLGAAAGLPVGSQARAVLARTRPSRRWIRIEPRRGQVLIGLYFSEADAQRIAASLRSGQGSVALVQALARMFRAGDSGTTAPSQHEGGAGETAELEFEGLAPSARRRLPAGFLAALRARLQAWVLPALSAWARDNAEAFKRAAGDPAAGVTVRIRLTSVPGFDAVRQAMLARPGAPGAAVPATVPRGTPSIAIDVRPGRGR